MSEPFIHPTAVISPEAKIGNRVSIGAYSIIEKDCVIGDDCIIDAHVKIARYSIIGENCRINFGAVIGDLPQDYSFNPDTVSYTRIGNSVTIREYVTIHRATVENGETSVGDNSMLMAFVHVGHDGKVGNRVTIANNTVLAGHVQVGDGAVISAYIPIHQFCRIGKLAMIGGGSKVRQDIPDYCMVGEGENICGINTIGLRRAGFDDQKRLRIKKIIKTYFFRHLNSAQALAAINEEFPGDPDAAAFENFIKTSKRGIMAGTPLFTGEK